MNVNQVSVGTSATPIVAANPGRSCCLITPTADVYIGGSSVTTSSGHLVKANTTVPYETTGAIYGIVASGTSTVTYADESGSGWPVQTIN
jgi:hypothetical protein